MLPNPKNAPTVRDQQTIYFSVATPIFTQFLFPERGVIGRHITALRTAVPKAPVYEYRRTCLPESKIRTAGQ
jgi:hypothetical protein